MTSETLPFNTTRAYNGRTISYFMIDCKHKCERIKKEIVNSFMNFPP